MLLFLSVLFENIIINIWVLSPSLLHSDCTSAMAEKVWLTFMNSGGLTEAQIRAELEVFGSVLECDGAIGGEGWVMVAMADKQEADKAVKCLKVGLKPCDCKL